MSKRDPFGAVKDEYMRPSDAGPIVKRNAVDINFNRSLHDPGYQSTFGMEYSILPIPSTQVYQPPPTISQDVEMKDMSTPVQPTQANRPIAFANKDNVEPPKPAVEIERNSTYISLIKDGDEKNGLSYFRISNTATKPKTSVRCYNIDTDTKYQYCKNVENLKKQVHDTMLRDGRNVLVESGGNRGKRIKGVEHNAITWFDAALKHLNTKGMHSTLVRF